MDEEHFREIAQQEATKVYQNLGTRFGMPQVPRHIHNNIDAPNIPPDSLTNTIILSNQNGEVLNNILVSNIGSPVVVFPVPILSAIPTGFAMDGTLVLTTEGTPGLYARIAGSWVFIGPTH